VNDLSRVSEGFFEEIFGVPVRRSCFPVVSLAFIDLVFWGFCAFMFQSLCCFSSFSVSLFIGLVGCSGSMEGCSCSDPRVLWLVYLAFGGLFFLLQGLFFTLSFLFHAMMIHKGFGLEFLIWF
jgi:hypothetical protein